MTKEELKKILDDRFWKQVYEGMDIRKFHETLAETILSVASEVLAKEEKK